MSKDKLAYKMTLLGDTGVGKTSLFKKLVKGTYEEKTISTIGIDKKSLNFQINTSDGEKEAEITLFDTAGQEKFRSISVSYFRESKGLVMVYDIISMFLSLPVCFAQTTTNVKEKSSVSTTTNTQKEEKDTNNISLLGSENIYARELFNNIIRE